MLKYDMVKPAAICVVALVSEQYEKYYVTFLL